MSTYTTGDLARKVGVSIRTVQYYDRKKLVIPFKISEGGRRIYSDTELKRLKFVLLLKSLGLSLSTIRDLLDSSEFNNVLKDLLKQKRTQLDQEISEKKDQLDSIIKVENGLNNGLPLSPNSLNDVEKIMEKSKKLFWLRTRLIAFGLILDVLEIGVIWYGIVTGNWLPCLVGFIAVFIFVYFLMTNYYRNVRYICPNCEKIFQPRLKDFFFSRHTPKTRQLTCPNCHYHGFCAEISK
ncbi:MerR family transcriptional regulator [Pediococcus stilesii]|uniref:Transcriptional regulator n=1 Tax=Pediococcus stilesii TaxID=331679 RepID=A0A0R2KV04_9LACO|nr:MerR family transcriptional regulator [Pediococcus stilesii]KRN93391.1 transcriptional regulator [Pediococcus stilesii]